MALRRRSQTWLIGVLGTRPWPFQERVWSYCMNWKAKPLPAWETEAEGQGNRVDHTYHADQDPALHRLLPAAKSHRLLWRAWGAVGGGRAAPSRLVGPVTPAPAMTAPLMWPVLFAAGGAGCVGFVPGLPWLGFLVGGSWLCIVVKESMTWLATPRVPAVAPSPNAEAAAQWEAVWTAVLAGSNVDSQALRALLSASARDLGTYTGMTSAPTH
jgi:hypothetical protein